MIRPKSVPNHSWWDWCKSRVPHSPPPTPHTRILLGLETVRQLLNGDYNVRGKCSAPRTHHNDPESSNPDLALISFQVSKTWLWQNNQRKAPLRCLATKAISRQRTEAQCCTNFLIVNTRGIILSRSQILTAWEKTMSCLLRISYRREACLASSCYHMIWNMKRRTLSVFWLPKVHLREFGFVSK